MNNYDISPRQFLREEKITSIFANLLDKAVKGSLKDSTPEKREEEIVFNDET